MSTNMERIWRAHDRTINRGLLIGVIGLLIGLLCCLVLYFVFGNNPIELLALVPQAVFYVVGLSWSFRKHKREATVEEAGKDGAR